MNKICVILNFYFFFCATNSSAQTVILSYDGTGNRITKHQANSPVAASIVGDTLACEYDIVTYRAHGGVTYAWSNGATDSVMSVMADTSMRFEVYTYNSYGCADSASAHLTVRPVGSTGPIAGNHWVVLSAPVVYDTFTVPLHLGSFYNWTVTNGSISFGYGTNRIVAAFIATGTGYVSVFESLYGGMCETLPIEIADTVANSDGSYLPLGTLPFANSYEFNIYPNPSSGNVLVDFAEEGCPQIAISIFNVVGQSVYEKTVSGLGNFHLSLDKSIFASPGLYMVQVRTENELHNSKIAIVR